MADWYRVTPVSASERDDLPSFVTDRVDLDGVVIVRVPAHVLAEEGVIERVYDAVGSRDVWVLSDVVEFVRLERIEGPAEEGDDG